MDKLKIQMSFHYTNLYKDMSLMSKETCFCTCFGNENPHSDTTKCAIQWAYSTSYKVKMSIKIELKIKRSYAIQTGHLSCKALGFIRVKVLFH